MIKSLLRGVAVASVAAAFILPVRVAAEETRLIFTTLSAPNSDTAVHIYHHWAKRVNDAGGGALAIDVRDGYSLATFTNFYDRVTNDVVQVTFGSLNYVAGKFRLSGLMGLPYVLDNAEQGSVLFWRLYESGAMDSEFDEIRPIFFMVFPQYSIHLTRTPASLESLSGLRIIASGKTTSEVVAKLGGAPTSIPLAETYAALQRGTADGLIFPWGGFAAFKLGDVTSYHIDTALGGGPGLVFLAKKKYDALPTAARKVLHAHSGEAESRRYGAALDRLHEANRKATQAQPNHKVVTLTPAQESKWKEAVAPVMEEWKAATPGSERVLAIVREELPKIKAGQ